jgi:formylglycine-generating enzyme required for sulfatase activity
VWYKVTGQKPWSGQSYTQENPQNAVSYVSWEDIKRDFLPKLGGKEYALPTEAQWEYACRGGTTARFYWGNDGGYSQIGEYAWYAGSRKGDYAHPVAQKRPNGWGLCDMSGNVYEWCEDWKEKYPSEEVKDPTGPPDASYRVLRGGSWNDYARYCR